MKCADCKTEIPINDFANHYCHFKGASVVSVFNKKLCSFCMTQATAEIRATDSKVYHICHLCISIISNFKEGDS